MAKDDDNNNRTDGEPEKPPLGTRIKTSLSSFGSFLYNSKDGTVMGRTGLSWLAILAFYVGFYAFLAAFWAACLAAFMRTTIDFTQPTQQHKLSLLKDNPGMTIEPLPTTDNTIIAFNSSNHSSYSRYVERLHNVTSMYSNLTEKYFARNGNVSNVRHCDPTDWKQQSNLNYVCLFDIEEMIPADSGCREDNQFGFTDGTPCVFLRANKIFNYQPERYDPATVNETVRSNNPPPMLFNADSPIVTGSNNSYVTCEGETPIDAQNLLKVEIFPKSGIPFNFFPFLMQNNYMPPFVMAKLTVIPGRVLMIWCRLWAKGIQHDRNDLQGSIHFELMVDH